MCLDQNVKGREHDMFEEPKKSPECTRGKVGQYEVGKVGRGRIVRGYSRGGKCEFYSEHKWEATGGF